MKQDTDAVGHGSESGQPVSFTATVVYVQPGFEELRRRFTDVEEELDDLGRPFEDIEEVERTDSSVKEGESRELVFELVGWGPSIFPDGNGAEEDVKARLKRENAAFDGLFVEMGRRGLRPARYEELLGFHARHPEEAKKHTIMAVGSIAEMKTMWGLFAYISSRGTHLGTVLCDEIAIFDDCVFLAVRKTVSAKAAADM